MATPKKKTILDYFSQAKTGQEGSSSAGDSPGTSSQLQRGDASVGPETPKKSKMSGSRMAVDSSDADSIEQLSESCIFSPSSATDILSSAADSPSPAADLSSKRPSVCSKLDRFSIQENGAQAPAARTWPVSSTSHRMGAIIADFLDVEAEELDTAEVPADGASLDGKKSEARYEFLLEIRDKSMRRRGEEGYDPSTLHIPSRYYQRFTSFEKQFWDIKCEYYDTVIFFKKGKFYELYEGDAEIASRLFDLKVTERVNMKMAGFPESSYEAWAARFLSHGYKIGKVEQVENAIGKKIREQNGKKDKIISRELKEVVTQGTIYSSECIHSSFPFYLAVLVQDGTCYAGQCCGPLHFSLVLYDASTNRIFVRSFCDSHDMNELKSVFVQNDVKELITDLEIRLPGGVAVSRPAKAPIASQRKYDFANDREFLCFTYLYNYMKSLCREPCLSSAVISDLHDGASFMSLDGSTLLNMDILANNFDGTGDNTLFKAINYCSTPFGQRLLKKWLVAPLTSVERILERRSAAEVFAAGSTDGLSAGLRELGDLERCFGKLSSCSPSFKDMSVLVQGLRRSRSFFELLVGFLEGERRDSQVEAARTHLRAVGGVLASFDGTYRLAEAEILPGNENDELFALGREIERARRQLDVFLQDLQRSTGISDLCYRSIGKEIFQVEAPSSASLPPGFFAVSSTKTHRRFYSRDLKDLVGHLVETEEKVFQSQGSILRRAVELLKQHALDIHRAVGYLASVDCFISFARFARLNKTARPVFCDKLEMVGFTNPVYPDYVRNTFRPRRRITLVTGPNMGGKSTYLRSICLNIVLAQIGMDVPCEHMSLPVFDRIFTRIGASDSLARGESTFMVELSEASKILNHSTSRSFVIMDELGRGTSTRDGEAIAKAVLDYAKGLGCHMLFSTHYHGLVEEYGGTDKSYVRCKLDSGDITFLYKVESGICRDSHGLYVAKLAGIPDRVVARSFEIRESLLGKEN